MKNKDIVCSSDVETDYFDIVAGIFQGDTLAPFLFIVWLDYERQASVENGFKLKQKPRSR